MATQKGAELPVLQVLVPLVMPAIPIGILNRLRRLPQVVAPGEDSVRPLESPRALDVQSIFTDRSSLDGPDLAELEIAQVSRTPRDGEPSPDERLQLVDDCFCDSFHL